MAKEAHGYFTEDGTFYERKEAAELHEAKELIRGELFGREIKPDPIIELLDELRPQIEDYYAKATAEAKTFKTADHDGAGEDDSLGSEPGGSETDTSIYDGGQSRAKGIQQQPRSRSKSVPNVGRRKRTKAVQDSSKEHGT